MIVLGTHTAMHWDLFLLLLHPLTTIFHPLQPSLPLPPFSHPSLYIFLLSSHYSLLHSCLPSLRLPSSSISSLSLFPLPPSPHFIPFSCFPYSTAVGGEIQVVETIMKWLTPRQDGAIDPLTPNALMSTLRPLLRLSKLKYRTLWGKPSLVPRPRPAFRRLQYGKAGRAWYLFSHEYDVISKLRKFAELTGCILRIFNRLHTQRSVYKTIASH